MCMHHFLGSYTWEMSVLPLRSSHSPRVSTSYLLPSLLGRGSNLKEEILHYGGSGWLQSMGCLVSYITLVVKKQSDDMGRVEDVNLSPVTVTPLQSGSSS